MNKVVSSKVLVDQLKPFKTCSIFSLIVVAILSINAQAADSCFPRTGACIVATVNGHSVVPLKSKKQLKPYEDISHYVDQASGYIPNPISGPLDVQLALTNTGVAKLGTPARQIIEVVALEQVELKSSAKAAVDPNVRVSGAASVGVANVLDSNVLPSGKYLLRLKVTGSNNWDRKTIFIEVDQSAKQPTDESN